MRLQVTQDQILPALVRVRLVLGEVRVEVQRTAVEHDRMATWYAERGDQDAVRMERGAAAAQRLRLAGLDAAFQALEKAASAALELDPGLPTQLP